jgi:hypothetical protein
MDRTLKVVIVGVVAVSLLGCCREIEKQLEDCQARLEDCQGQPEALQIGGETPAQFTIAVEADGFATFQPFSNQYRGQSGREFRDGFLLQIGDYLQAVHAYDVIKLEDASGNTIKDYQRGAGPPSWIDIECGRTDQNPITLDMAKLLVPIQANPATHGYKLHGLLDLNTPVTAVTMWAPASGLRVQTVTDLFPPVGEYSAHGHVKFHFTSSEPCEVRVWSSMDDSAPADVYSTADSPRVARVVVRETTTSPRHGGLHFPSWP